MNIMELIANIASFTIRDLAMTQLRLQQLSLWLATASPAQDIVAVLIADAQLPKPVCHVMVTILELDQMARLQIKAAKQNDNHVTSDELARCWLNMLAKHYQLVTEDVYVKMSLLAELLSDFAAPINTEVSAEWRLSYFQLMFIANFEHYLRRAFDEFSAAGEFAESLSQEQQHTLKIYDEMIVIMQSKKTAENAAQLELDCQDIARQRQELERRFAHELNQPENVLNELRNKMQQAIKAEYALLIQPSLFNRLAQVPGSAYGKVSQVVGGLSLFSRALSPTRDTPLKPPSLSS